MDSFWPWENIFVFLKMSLENFCQELEGELNLCNFASQARELKFHQNLCRVWQHRSKIPLWGGRNRKNLGSLLAATLA